MQKMKFDIFKTRRGKLKTNLETKLLNKTVGSSEIETILNIVDEYENDNLDTIEKLKRNKKVELNKINGALKQSINAHGPITKTLIGSASKRIYGSLLNNKKSIKNKYFVYYLMGFLLLIMLVIILCFFL